MARWMFALAAALLHWAEPAEAQSSPEEEAATLPRAGSAPEFLAAAQDAEARAAQAGLDAMLQGPTNLRVRFQLGAAQLTPDEAERIAAWLRTQQAGSEIMVYSAAPPQDDRAIEGRLAHYRTTALREALLAGGVAPRLITMETGPRTTSGGAGPAGDYQLLLGPALAAISAPVERAQMPSLGRGTVGAQYDVVIQPGHYLRSSGSTGAQGGNISEQALVSHIVARTSQRLAERGVNVLVVSADEYITDNASTEPYEGLSAKIFLSVHADGSERPCTTGPSLGYAGDTDVYAMHMIARGLARALGYEDYAKFMTENFTAGLSSYYMFRRVRSSERVRGVLEVGELTCSADEAHIISAWEPIADNLAISLWALLAQSGSQ